MARVIGSAVCMALGVIAGVIGSAAFTSNDTPIEAGERPEVSCSRELAEEGPERPVPEPLMTGPATGQAILLKQIQEVRKRRASLVFNGFLGSRMGASDRGDWRAIFAKLDGLDTPYFVDSLHSHLAQGNLKYATIALEVTMFAGGLDCSKVLESILSSQVHEDLRVSALTALGGTTGSLTRHDRIPITGELEALAFQLCRSANPIERYGAIGMLGSIRSEPAQAELVRLLRLEEKAELRCAVVWALGRQGLKGSAEVLQDLQSTLRDGSDRDTKSLKRWLSISLRDLEFTSQGG